MWHSWGGGNGGYVPGGEADDAAAMQQPLVAVAIDKDKGSQNALKWTLDNLVTRGQTIMLLHVFNNKPSAPPRSAASSPAHSFTGSQEDAQMKEVFLPFRCFCSLKQVHCKDVALEDTDVAKAIVEFVAHSAIEKLVVGHSTKNQFLRFKSSDIPHAISKGAPDFCTVYVIHKGKVSSERKAARQAPATSLLKQQLRSQNSTRQEASDLPSLCPRAPESPFQNYRLQESIRSPFSRESISAVTRSYGDRTASETDISFVSSGRPSVDRIFPSLHNQYPDPSRPPRLSNGSDFDRSFDLTLTPQKRSVDGCMFSTFSNESGSTTWSSQAMDEVEAEMRRLRLELKQTMDMYSTACKEALTANQKAKELHRWKVEEEQRLQEALLSEEAALAIAETEKAKCRAAIDAAEAAQRLAQLEAQKRINAETKAHKEAEEKKRALDALALGGGGGRDLRYRKYTIEEIEAATDYFAESRQIGEGGYGPVYKCHLDHTPVAIKVLRSNAAQGRSQFQQEVEVLSCIRHPNMVLLLGACPEYGCLVYEYMANGSLDDRLFRRGNTPALPWQVRFRIAADICTGLLFLHQTKPEPLVHRDLKPANILLDRNNVSKISDVGLARLVPPSVADSVTQYRMTSTAGTFCYIDPEYQQTGMLGVKSDIYSLGILLLQLVTARSPMGLTHHVERAIERGTFREMLDPAVPDWPVDKALILAKVALSCAELRRKDRPDLGAVVLPVVDKLRDFADAHVVNQQQDAVAAGWLPTSANHSQTSISYDVMSDPQVHASYESSIRSYAPSLGK